MAVYRGKSLEEARASAKDAQPVCRSCRLRFTVDPAPLRELYGSGNIAPQTLRWLENAARVFDAETDPGDQWTAADFIAWLRPDILGYSVKVPEADGAKPVSESKNVNRHPDPIPYAPIPRSAA